jgi:hypothetical protein
LRSSLTCASRGDENLVFRIGAVVVVGAGTVAGALVGAALVDGVAMTVVVTGAAAFIMGAAMVEAEAGAAI